MTTLRRRVLRASRTPIVNDARTAGRQQRQRERLLKDRAALKRWLTRLKRATNTVTDLHQRISRAEAALLGSN